MHQDELEQVENPAIAQLQQLGWTFIPGAQLTTEQGERASLRDVILTNRLNAAINRINPWIRTKESTIHLLFTNQTSHKPTTPTIYYTPNNHP